MSRVDYSQFITERVDEGLNFNRNHRFFLIYGKVTADEFLTRSFSRAKLRETLWATLKENKISRVIFYNAADKFFFLDEESRGLAQQLGNPGAVQETRTSQGRARMQSGPLGNRNVLSGRTRMVTGTASGHAKTPAPGRGSEREEPARAKAPTPAASVRTEGDNGFPRMISMAPSRGSGMSDVAVLTTLNDFMNDQAVRTAIVIEDMENLSRRFDDGIKDQLAARLRDWSSLLAANRNVLIFITNREPTDEQSVEVIRRLGADFSEIANLINVALGENRAEAEGVAWYVPTPYEPEVIRLLHEFRLRSGLKVVWSEFDRIVRWLVADNKQLRDVDGRLNEYLANFRQKDDTISLDLLRRLNWGRSSSTVDTRPLSARERLNEMIGMKEVKDEINKHVSYLQAEKKKREHNPQLRSTPLNLHLVLTGNPGTGKTTVARLIGEIYRDLGLLKRGHTVECDSSRLVAGYVGQTAARTNERVNEALDGVLFVDEAYSLSEGESSFGREAITTLVARMENERHRLAVIVAGYPIEMEKFITSNPGLSGRFPTKIQIKDYLPEELVEIFEQMITDMGHTISDEMRNTVKALLQRMYELREDRNYFEVNDKGKSSYRNAGTVRNLVEAMVREQASRLAGEVEKELTAEDVPESYRRFLGDVLVEAESEKQINELLKELNGLIGLQPAKRLVEKLLIEQRLAIALKRDVTATGKTRHMVFTGNPGTGKTTVARIIGRIYRALGILRGNSLVEVQRADLVGQYLGETAQKTTKVVESAMDGVLFIDEAYSLSTDERDVYGREAINTLVPALENFRERLVVIFAGYTEEMRTFLGANAGLKSRIGYTIDFPDYSADELVEIFLGLASADGKTVPDEVRSKLANQFAAILESPDQQFDNGRDVRIKFYQPMVEEFDQRMYQALEAKEDLSKFPQAFILEDLLRIAPAENEPKSQVRGRTNNFNVREIVSSQRLAPVSNAPDRVGTAVGFIKTDRGSGTGFLIGSSGHILTAYHVIEGARSIGFRLNGTPDLQKISYLDGDKGLDLAILRIEGDNWPYVKLAKPGYEVGLGTQLGLLGYPMGESLGEEVTYTAGALSSVRRTPFRTFLQIDVSAYKGNSGGPVFINATGEVIGILSHGPNDTMNFATSIEEFYQHFS
jgi:S1-C subfamily serine protease/SpoVK/Ycf46/Vps4 family AAA+-type ATPase